MEVKHDISSLDTRLSKSKAKARVQKEPQSCKVLNLETRKHPSVKRLPDYLFSVTEKWVRQIRKAWVKVRNMERV